MTKFIKGYENDGDGAEFQSEKSRHKRLLAGPKFNSVDLCLLFKSIEMPYWYFALALQRTHLTR